MGRPLGQTPGEEAAPNDMAVQLDDSDWEYEYDDTQTEDFYFTLDLPGTVEPASKRRKMATQKARENEALDPALGPWKSQYITNGHTQHRHEALEQRAEPIHFTNLHTTTPVIEYCGQRYECRWTTDLGTQFHISRPRVTKRPYRAGHAVDVVALSRVRLTGLADSAAAAQPKKSVMGDNAGGVIVLDDDQNDDELSGETDAVDSYGRQPSFLQRVAEIQRRKARDSRPAANGLDPQEMVFIDPSSRSISAAPVTSAGNEAGPISRPSDAQTTSDMPSTRSAPLAQTVSDEAIARSVFAANVQQRPDGRWTS